MSAPRIEVTKVRDVNGNSIPLTWALEFGGYFMADGCLYLSRHYYTKGGKWMYQPQARINQRADSRPLLEAIQTKLGGHIRDYKGVPGSAQGKVYQCNPTSCWTTSSHECMERVLGLLDYLSLPHVKLVQAGVMREYLDYRSQFGQRHGDEARDRIHQFWQELRELKKYSSE